MRLAIHDEKGQKGRLGLSVRQDADTRRLQAIAEAKARLIEAIGNLQREGGQIYFDKENLRKILDVGLPPEEPPEEPTVTNILPV